MPGPLIVVKNALATANSVTATSPATGFVEALLSDLFVGLPFKFGTPAVGDQIAIDMGTAKQPVFVGVHNPNFESDVDVRYQVADDASFTTNLETFATLGVPAREPDVPVSDGGLFPDFYAAEGQTGVTTVTARRHHRLRVFAVGSQTAVWKIGQLVVGVAGDLITLAKSFRFGMAGGEEPAAQLFETQAGGVWASFTREAAQEFTLSWQGLSETNRKQIRDVYRRTLGPVLPFSVAPFPTVSVDTAKRTEVYFARFRSPFSYVDNFETDKSVNGILLREEAREFQG